MCGIIGYVGKENAVPLILEGLKKLEYRGYDSAGIAVYHDGALEVAKKKGRLAGLEAEIAEHPIAGNTGIGHTRWATHGEPSNVNSHPHLGRNGRIAVVHNGIIENYQQLREQLMERGVRFASDTDSEVIAQLTEYYDRGNMVETVIKVISMLEGSYALGFISVDEPDKIIAVRKDNPLIIGLGDGGNFIASDVPAILRHTDQVVYLEDKEIAVLSGDAVQFYDIAGEPIEKAAETISWSMESAEKAGYEHFMFKEIMEQPRVLRDTIRSAMADGKNRAVLDEIDIGRYKKFVITACGSAYNAGVVGRYVIERLCRISVEVELASEFRYKDPIIDEGTLVLLISQSGETADTIAAMREAKAKGATTVSIVNVVGSTIAKETDYTLFTLAGPEIAVATTKAFSAQLTLLYIIAARFAARLKTMEEDAGEALWKEIAELPERAEAILGMIEDVQRFANTCVNYKSIFFIGRNVDYAISLEGSLKLKEISYIHSEAYAGGELKHGTISLIEENTLVVAIAFCKRLVGKTMSNVEQVISRGAKVLLVTDSAQITPTERLTVLRVPEVDERLSPSLSVILLQLLAYFVAANKGLDIDKPRNLAKSVTVE